MTTDSPLLLIVDDDPTARQVAQAILSQDMYTFRHASGGEVALSQIDEQEPDLVLLDVMMPGIDGFEVCRRIRQRKTRAYLPIMMITALDSPKDLMRGRTTSYRSRCRGWSCGRGYGRCCGSAASTWSWCSRRGSSRS
jgi:DNA-binding response OmpR family regulator